MNERAVESNTDASISLSTATLAVIGRAVGTWPRRWLFAIMLFLGLAAAVGLTAAGSPADRTFAAVSGPVQSLMSVVVPFIGVLLVDDLRRAPRRPRLAPTLLAAVLVAVAVGAFGVVACALAVGVAPAGPADPWAHFATVAVGSLLVQSVAQLVGTGLGLVLRPVVVACLATIVLPLGLWFVLGAVEVLRPAQAWLTPYPSVQHLLSGEMTAVAWAQWFVVLLLWGVGLNAVAASRLK